MIDFTSLFSPYDVETNDNIFLNYFKDEWMQFHWNWNKTNLTDQTKFRLNKIAKIENYFNQEINQRKSHSKKIKQVCYYFWLHRQGLNFFKCKRWWSTYHFFYKHWGSTSWNSKRKFYSNFFSNNRNNEKTTGYEKKQKEKAW